MHLVIVLMAVSPALSQYYSPNRMRADLTFGNYNKRFDLTPLIQNEERNYKGYALEPAANYDDVGTDMYEFTRRRFETNKLTNKNKHENSKADTRKYNVGFIDTKKKRKQLQHINDLANQLLYYKLTGRFHNRRFNEEDFAYHDNMNNEGYELDRLEIDDNNENDEYNRYSNRLESFVNNQQGASSRRRVADTEREILFHHAFPMDIKVNGYLQLPVK